METLSAYVCRDRWEGRLSAGELEPEPENLGDRSLRREWRVWALFSCTWGCCGGTCLLCERELSARVGETFGLMDISEVVCCGLGALDYIVLVHANWDSNLATKTHLASTRRIEVKSVTNYDAWFPTICDSLENMSD